MATNKKGGPKKGYKQKPSHKKAIAKAQNNTKNSNFKHGKRRDYRKIAKASDDEIIHHADGNRMNNSPSNLKPLKRKDNKAKTSSTHEKITKRGQGRKPKK